MSLKHLFTSLAALCLPCITAAQTEDAIAQPGALIVEPPTTTALGVEWRIGGDNNRNASVELAWQRAGDTNWHA
ncbi:MAG: hypothetical protein SV422_09880, partial [Pseudomonadota bacterium]|nr:hypothetical protein [Pseudomonadota bacterium]